MKVTSLHDVPKTICPSQLWKTPSYDSTGLLQNVVFWCHCLFKVFPVKSSFIVGFNSIGGNGCRTSPYNVLV